MSYDIPENLTRTEPTDTGERMKWLRDWAEVAIQKGDYADATWKLRDAHDLALNLIEAANAS